MTEKQQKILESLYRLDSLHSAAPKRNEVLLLTALVFVVTLTLVWVF